MMRALVVALVLLAGGQVRADEAAPAKSDEWSSVDIKRQAVVTVLLVADYLQTRDQYVRRAEGYSEINPLIRANYSPSGISNYFGYMIVGSAMVTRALPSAYRPAWQYSIMALEVAAIVKNKRVGLHFRF